jgi:hypothetical protein
MVISFFVYSLCCIFLAGKTEDSYVSLKQLLKVMPMFTEELVLDAEVSLIEVQ